MSKLLMYTTKWCPFCVMAKRLLATKGVDVEEVPVDTDPARRAEMMQRSGRRTVPQIFVDERHLGGFDDIAALEHKGELDPLLAQVPKASK
ncbi:MAG TPA: glutaredoxin 3 [Verrucomicrobiae bacterium]|nr:glutaredoxin 3 [Verrucomicrobiae bacterium]